MAGFIQSQTWRRATKRAMMKAIKRLIKEGIYVDYYGGGVFVLENYQRAGLKNKKE